MSVGASDEDDYAKRNVVTTLKDFYRCSLSKDGKILNALDFHPAFVPAPPAALASDMEAHLRTQEMPFCVDPFPTHSFRWGLAATKDAHHFWHIDSDGLSTYVILKCGLKVWFSARPKTAMKENANYDAFADGSGYVAQFDVSSPNLDLWDVEYVILSPDVEL